MKHLALTQDNLPQQLETGNRRLLLAANLGDYPQAIEIAHETLARLNSTDTRLGRPNPGQPGYYRVAAGRLSPGPGSLPASSSH